MEHGQKAGPQHPNLSLAGCKVRAKLFGMSTDVRKPPSFQRKATDKRERTRAQVLRAAVEYIREEGLAAATASKIAQRCNLSWGVIQYHFSDRDGLLLAILEESVGSLRDLLLGLNDNELEASARVGALVDIIWSLMRRDTYRVLLEIQLHLASDQSRIAISTEKAVEMRQTLRDAWLDCFPECDPERVKRAERLATASLRGWAVEHAINPRRGMATAERNGLVDALSFLLGLCPNAAVDFRSA